jgi:hypothetical protein
MSPRGDLPSSSSDLSGVPPRIAGSTYATLDDEDEDEQLIHPYIDDDLDSNLRPVVQQSMCDALMDYVGACFRGLTPKSFIMSIFPIIKTMKGGYSWDAAKADVLCGLTLAVRSRSDPS